ncbi:hypothetical protein SteCoe_30071 [Stentor coeruleus]|uniref:Uncharacterized protein n=1 Tax=Stentor coeruleus TaxID=5963 RepID=A0A1R2B4G0_9CILI|nr:hypothetical protein SteCoe_30071 [Stentor coeruleus]
MFCKFYSSKRSHKKPTKFEQAKLLYSSRAERIKLITKLSPSPIKSREKSVEKKMLKVLIQMPQYDSDFSNENLHSNTPNAYVFPETTKIVYKRRIFKSDLEKVYSNRPRIVTPFRRLSASMAK